MFKLFFTNQDGTMDFSAIVTDDKSQYYEPGDKNAIFSLMAIENHSGCRGIRFIKFRADCGALDDYWDRCLFGICFHYGRPVIELLFMRILLG